MSDKDSNSFEKIFGPLFPQFPGVSVIKGGGKPPQRAALPIERSEAQITPNKERPREDPLVYVPVADIGDAFVVIALDGRKFDVAKPSGVAISAGDIVKITRDTLQIVGLADDAHRPHGIIATLVAKVTDATSEVSIDGQNIVVHNGKLKDSKIGRRIVLDASRTVIIDELPDLSLGLVGAPVKDVEWDDVGGLEEAKQEFRDAIEAPVLYADLYKFYAKEPPGGLLLWGPPGCGKTYLVAAAVTANRRVHKLPPGVSGALYVKGPELLSKFVGVTELNIRQVFATARAFYEKYHCPLLVFFDEADALFKKRGTGISSDVQDTIVPTLLTEMSGFDDNQVFAVFATNRVDILDPALLRDGRIDKKIFVGRPTIDVAQKIFEIHFRRLPIHETLLEPAILAAEQLFSPSRAYMSIECKALADPSETETIPFTLGNLASGAMIAGIVAKAGDAAFRRDREAKTRTGVMADDVVAAVELTWRENANLNHSDDLEVFLEGIEGVKDRLKGIVKLRQGSR